MIVILKRSSLFFNNFDFFGLGDDSFDFFEPLHFDIFNWHNFVPTVTKHNAMHPRIKILVLVLHSFKHTTLLEYSEANSSVILERLFNNQLRDVLGGGSFHGDKSDSFLSKVKAHFHLLHQISDLQCHQFSSWQTHLPK